MNKARGLSECDTLAWCDILFVKPHDYLLDTSESVLIRFVIVVEPNGRYLTHFTKINGNRVLLTLIERYQPHVMIVGRIVHSIY